MAENARATVAVAVRWPDGSTWFHDADHLLHAASTVKVALVVSAYRAMAMGKLDGRALVKVHNDFASHVSGGRFSVCRADDPDPELHARTLPVSVDELIRRTVRLSGNLATNLLLEVVGVAQVARDTEAIGVEGVHLVRGMDDDLAFKAGVVNQATARGLLSLATKLADRLACPPYDLAVLGHMGRVEHPFGLAAAAERGWRTPHKPGWITGYFHDFGVLVPPGWEATGQLPLPCLAVMTQGLQEATARGAVAGIARSTRDLSGL